MPNLKGLQAQVNEAEEQTPVVSTEYEPPKQEIPIAQSVWDEIVSAGETVPNNMIFCGLVGPEGVGKTGIVLDSMDEESKKRGDVIFVLDFDGGGQTTRVTHHREHANNIRCLNPNVMFETFDEDGEIREAID